MAVGRLSPIDYIVRFFRERGLLGPGYRVHVYVAETDVLAQTWRDPRLTVPNFNPMTIGATGDLAPVWAAAGTRLKIEFRDTANRVTRTIDNLPLLDESLDVPRTPQEARAGITPTNTAYAELNVLRYGALANLDDAAPVVQAAVSVLAQHVGGELVIPGGCVLNVTQAALQNLDNFTIRCDGVVRSIAVPPGADFTDQRPESQGKCSPFRITGCRNFKIYGIGRIENGRAETMYIVGCSNFDISLDLLGTGANSVLPGIWLQSCSKFTLHDMTWDSLTAQRMNDAKEVMHPWLNQAQIQQCQDFRIFNVTSRRSGMNGLYIGSDCCDFEVTQNTLEYNAGSGIQLAWQGFGSAPMRYRVNGNVIRYNQADGIDANNTSGAIASVFAQFNNNRLDYNGWINCNPSNAAGADGSGVGTFMLISNFEASGNTVRECASWGLFIDNCHDVVVSGNTVVKSRSGTKNGGIYISGMIDGHFLTCDIVVPRDRPALLMNPCTNVVFERNSLNGLITINNGKYVGCKMLKSKLCAYDQVATPFDMSNCIVTVDNPGQNGVYITNPAVTLESNAVTATNNAIAVTSLDQCTFLGNIAASTGTGCAIIVTNCSETTVRGNSATATSGNGIWITGSSSHTVLIDNKASSVTGNSFRVEATAMHTVNKGSVTVCGVESFLGTYDP